MSCVPPSTSNPPTPPTPQDILNQILLLISTLRGGESRFLPLVMAKIRDTFPSIAPALPPDLIRKAALMNGGPANIPTITSAPIVATIPVTVGLNSGGIQIKSESGTGSGSSEQSSPYATPPFTHYYPLA